MRFAQVVDHHIHCRLKDQTSATVFLAPNSRVVITAIRSQIVDNIIITMDITTAIVAKKTALTALPTPFALLASVPIPCTTQQLVIVHAIGISTDTTTEIPATVAVVAMAVVFAVILMVVV